MDRTYRAARKHLSQDSVFRDIIAATTLAQHPSEDDVFLALLRTIVYQQLSGKAAGTIHRRFLSLFSETGPTPIALQRMAPETLCGAGLSRQKSAYVKNVADRWEASELAEVDWSMLPDEEIIQRLTTIKGVGTWTAQMILMFTLRRPDVFPVNDLGIRHAIVRAYRLRSRGSKLDKRLVQIAAPWSPYRTVACRYLWRWNDLQD